MSSAAGIVYVQTDYQLSIHCNRFESMTMHRRQDEIERFCHNFLRGHRQLHELIGNYERVFSHIDIQQFTQNTLDSSFRSVCSEVFPHRPVHNGYIIAALGFSQAIHKYHQDSSSWYTIDILMYSLVNVLEDINFHPNQLTPSHCNIL